MLLKELLKKTKKHSKTCKRQCCDDTNIATPRLLLKELLKEPKDTKKTCKRHRVGIPFTYSKSEKYNRTNIENKSVGPILAH